MYSIFRTEKKADALQASGLKVWRSINSEKPQSDNYSRRRFVVRALGYVAATVPFSFLISRTAQSDTQMVGPDAADLEIAALGGKFREAQPDTASRLEALALKDAGFAPSDSIDWEGARRAHLLLTERTRVSAELARGDVVFVEGWLLAHSEAGAALIFTSVGVQWASRSQSRMEK